MSNYLKFFNDHSGYEDFLPTEEFVRPNVSYCKQPRHVHYNPLIPPDYPNEYLTFVAKADGTFKFSGSTTANTISYSLDNGSTWVALADNTDTPTITSGRKIIWKGACTPQRLKGVGRFSSTAQFDVEGNAMSLLFGDDFKEKTSLVGKNYAFYGLFYQDTNIVNAKNLILPATTLSDYCYCIMFSSCLNLMTAPELPATTLAKDCYSIMFQGCTSLTKAPELPATTLAEDCYSSMFNSCTSLTTAPSVLPATDLSGAYYCYSAMFTKCSSLTATPVISATTLAAYCCSNMFNSCTSLTTAPQLPATTLANSCYSGMFSGCTALTEATALPATTLANSAYTDMFSGCISLTTAPSVLPATTLAIQCYYRMFSGCTSLTIAPELPATILANDCYYEMFRGCTSLNSVTCLATDKSANSCTYNWLRDVASSGTFKKAASMTSWTTGNSGIPNGWTVVDALA